jgi:hypothetical protein
MHNMQHLLVRPEEPTLAMLLGMRGGDGLAMDEVMRNMQEEPDGAEVRVMRVTRRVFDRAAEMMRRGEGGSTTAR